MHKKLSTFFIRFDNKYLFTYLSEIRREKIVYAFFCVENAWVDWLKREQETIGNFFPYVGTQRDLLDPRSTNVHNDRAVPSCLGNNVEKASLASFSPLTYSPFQSPLRRREEKNLDDTWVTNKYVATF